MKNKFALLFTIAGIVLFQIFASHWFSAPPGGSINFKRSLAAAAVGGVSAVIGALIDNVVSKKQ